jgi:drug/metabolite transporter (DMT)-like permease
MSFNGVLIRILESANGFQVLFYRSIGLCIFVLFFIGLKRKTSIIGVFKTIDVWDVAVGMCLGFAFSSYVFSIFYTSVAYTLFILSSTPLIAALFSWLLLDEKPGLVTGLAMLLSLFGVVIMVRAGISIGTGWAQCLALISAVSFAGMLVTTRRSHKSDVLTGTFLGGVFSGVFGLFASIFFLNGLSVSFYDLSLMILMGALAIGLGITLVTLAAPFVPSSEVSVLVLLESVLGPLWVWMFLKEAVSQSELVGGGIILFSVFLLSNPLKWVNK